MSKYKVTITFTGIDANNQYEAVEKIKAKLDQNNDYFSMRTINAEIEESVELLI